MHVYFHGCSMSADLISTSFIEDSGLLEMADANQIVLLLPQVSMYSWRIKGLNKALYMEYGIKLP